MRLKEFDLDLPDAERWTRHAFRHQSRCVTALYERCFSGGVVDSAWKVLVECVASVDRSNMRDLDGVFVIQAAMNMAELEQAQGVARKAMFLEILHRGVIDVASARGWPVEPFEAARQGVLERQYVNEWTSKRARSSPDRKHRAFLCCAHEMEHFRSWLVIRRKGQEVARVLAVDEPPSEFAFVQKLGKLAWSSNQRVELLDRKGQPVASLSIPVNGGESE